MQHVPGRDFRVRLAERKHVDADVRVAASRGERAPDVKTYKPVIDIHAIKPFTEEYLKHRGNFDELQGYDDVAATALPAA